MLSILIIAEESGLIKELTERLNHSGISSSVASDIQQALAKAEERSPDLILADIKNEADMSQVMDMPFKINMKRNPLMMVMIPGTMMNDVANETGVADFIIKPCDKNELFTRISRLVKKIKSKDLKKIITSGDLVIDTVSCEVSLGGRLIELTFKEYELLRFLAASKGQVFTREILLNKVWKYDYLGGERTVDVHIRRLRSKIEDADHTYIETVRNIGYRFRKDT